MATHYETLGVRAGADAGEIKRAFRQIALRHHPDRSKDPASKAIFLAANDAYQVLSDPERRRAYDEILELDRQKAERLKAERLKAERERAERQRVERQRAESGQPQPRSAPRPTVAADVAQLSNLYAKGRTAEAEALARQILARDGRQAVPYAVLGDLARLRGSRDEAARMYAYAAQMDGRNPVYQRRHEEMLSAVAVEEQVGPTPARAVAPLVGAAIVLLAASYLGLSGERAAFAPLAWISTWTLGFVLMQFLGGVAMGATLSLGGQLDRFEAATRNVLGAVSPVFALGLVAIVNYWAAAALMLLVGLFRRALPRAMLVLMGAVAGTTLVLAGGSALGGASFGQSILWGGNLVYLGALVGWLVADAFQAGTTA